MSTRWPAPFLHRVSARAFARALALAAAVLLLGAVEANAQEAAGQIFNQIFNVGGPGVRTNQADPGFVAFFSGSQGCGGTVGPNGGGDLTAALDQGGATPVNDKAQSDSGSRSQTRALWRFCDNLTNSGGGWSGAFQPNPDENTMAPNNIFITAEQEFQQSIGMAPDELFAAMTYVSSLAQIQSTNVAQRLKTVRIARRGEAEGPAWGLADRRGDAPIGDWPGAVRAGGGVSLASVLANGLTSGQDAFGVAGLGVFLNGQYAYYDAESTPFQTGAVSNGGGFTAGVDYFFTDSLFAGVGFGYSRLETNFKNSAGEAKLDDYTFLVYGSYFATDRFYVDGNLAASILRFEQKKVVPAFDLGQNGATPFAPLQSSPEGVYVGFNVGAGGEIPAWRMLWNPYVRLAVQHTAIDRFTEAGGDGTLSLTINAQSNTSLTSTVGLQISHPISTPVAVISPHIRGEWVHEYLDQADRINGFLTVIPQAVFQVLPNPVDRDYALAGVGVSAGFENGVSAFLDWDGLWGFKKLDSHRLTGGVRLSF